MNCLNCLKAFKLGMTLLAAAPVLVAQPDGKDIATAIPAYFGQTLTDIIDRTTNPNQVYAITLARGQEMTVSASTAEAKGYFLNILAPNTQSVLRLASGQVLGRDDASCSVRSRSVTYSASAAGVYFIWIGARSAFDCGDAGASVRYTLRITAQGTPIAVPNPPTAGCLNGRVESITYSLQLIAAGLPDEVTIGGTRACASCQVKSPRYPEISNRLENALRSRINVEACYDASGNIFQLKMAQ